MKKQLVCPQCHASQTVQRVATIAANRVRVGYIVSSPEQAAQVANRETNLGRLFAPPRRPSGNGRLILILLVALLVLSLPVSCVLTMALVGLQANVTQELLFSGASQWLFLLVGSVVALGSITVVVFVAQWSERRQRPAIEQWNKQIARWQQAHYCYHCHITFVPGTNKAVPAEQLTQILAA